MATVGMQKNQPFFEHVPKAGWPVFQETPQVKGKMLIFQKNQSKFQNSSL
jgi:hypothetical protein